MIIKNDVNPTGLGITGNLMTLDLILWHSPTNQTRKWIWRKTWLLEPELKCKFAVSFLFKWTSPPMPIHEVVRWSQGKIIFSSSHSFWICFFRKWNWSLSCYFSFLYMFILKNFYHLMANHFLLSSSPYL